MNDMPILLIDNKSPFCSKTMQLIFRRGGYNKFNFLSIYSEESKQLLTEYGIATNGEKLMVLCEKGKVFIKSGALLQVARKLNGFMPLIYWFAIIPQKIRDFFYDRISGYFPNK